MPIYAYRCTSCGHAQDVLRRISDPPLTDCPACGAATFAKQVTAAGFQLKGSGWYATDFRDGSGKAAKKDGGDGDGAAKDAAPAPAASEAKGDAAKPAVAPAAATPTPSSSPPAASPGAGS
jgi:putative FmdB family regulatory protein